MLHHMLVCFLVQEAFQWAEATNSEELNITCVALTALLDVVTALYQGFLIVMITHHQVDQRPSMGSDVPV